MCNAGAKTNDCNQTDIFLLSYQPATKPATKPAKYITSRRESKKRERCRAAPHQEMITQIGAPPVDPMRLSHELTSQKETALFRLVFYRAAVSAQRIATVGPFPQ